MGKTISSSSTNDICCSMKKSVLLTVLILTILILAVSTVDIVSSAVPYPVPTGPIAPPTISLESPTSTTYVRWFVPILFSLSGSWDGYVSSCFVELSLDGGPRYNVLSIPFRINRISRAFSTTLGPLSEGQHTVEIFATVSGTYRADSNSTILKTGSFTSKTSVNFKVDTEGQGQLTLLSPQNQTYNYNKDIPVTFNVNPNASITSMGYTLDQQSNVTIPRNTTIYGPISDGPHTLKVYSVFSDILPVYSTINFTVDTTPPNVSLISLEEETYNESTVPLVFTVNETTSLITYILDGKVHTSDGNTTMTILRDGDHTLKVYATDEAGNAGSTETISFNVQVPISPNLALGVLPPLLIVLVGGPIVLVYLKKRKQSSQL